MGSDFSRSNASGLCLDTLAQIPLLQKLYTQVTACYATPVSVTDEHIVGTLTRGLERLGAAVPWLAGQVAPNGSEKGCACDCSIVPWEKAPRLVVKDLRDDPTAPTMEQLRTSCFPMAALDESLLSPCKTLSHASDMTTYVFVVQATFIKGGLFLTFVAQHNTMDLTGQAEIIRFLSKACKEEDFTAEEIANANIDRHNIVPHLPDSWEPGPELDNQINPPSEPASTSPHCTWAYFAFSHDSIAKLMAVASKTVTAPATFVSRDDTVSAFIWQGVTRARLGRLDPGAESTFARAVDVRRSMKASPTYTGLLQNMAYNTCPTKNLASLPLGVVASHLRSSLDPHKLASRTQELATVIRRSLDKSKISFTARIDPSTDISFSSWGKARLYDLNFGLGLGKPEAVRRPRFEPVESLMYIMPVSPDGEVVVAMCLRDEDLEALRADDEFMGYATYIG